MGLEKTDTKKLYFEWLRTAASKRKPLTKRAFTREHDVNIQTLKKWDKDFRVGGGFNVDQFLNENLPDVLQGLVASSKDGNSAASKQILEILGVIAERKKGDDKPIEITADFIAKAVFGVEEELAKGGYAVQNPRVVQMSKVAHVLPHEIREDTGCGLGSDTVQSEVVASAGTPEDNVPLPEGDSPEVPPVGDNLADGGVCSTPSDILSGEQYPDTVEGTG